jgi:hypothetical protein
MGGILEKLPELAELALHVYDHSVHRAAFNLSHASQMRFVNDTDLDLKASTSGDHVSYEFGYSEITYKFPPKDVAPKNGCSIIATSNTWQVDIEGSIFYSHNGVKVLTINFKNPLVSINANRCEALVNTAAFPQLIAYVKHVSGSQDAHYDIILSMSSLSVKF